MFPATIGYLDTGKVKVEGIVNKTYKPEQWGECLEDMRNKTAIKAAIVFEYIQFLSLLLQFFLI